MAEEKKKHAGHGFKFTHIDHHDDGSATVHHQHEDGAEFDKKHAVADIDGIHDSIEDHLGDKNIGEDAADQGIDMDELQQIKEAKANTPGGKVEAVS